jgi:hypothetical protein
MRYCSTSGLWNTPQTFRPRLTPRLEQVARAGALTPHLQRAEAEAAALCQFEQPRRERVARIAEQPLQHGPPRHGRFGLRPSCH